MVFFQRAPTRETDQQEILDWARIRGYHEAKRALEIAASGYHSLLLVGPSGAGKAMLARSLSTILPGIPFIDVDPLMHLSVAIEQALSNHGLLFLEHIERWDEASLVLLRETMKAHAGQFLLVATCRPCPCGNFLERVRECLCTLDALESHRKRLRETLHTCFALEFHVPSDNPERRCRDETSLEVSKRVKATQELQRQCLGGRLTSMLSFAELQAEEALPLDEPAQHLLELAVVQLSLPSEQCLYLRQVAKTAAYMAIAHPIWEEPVTQIQSNHAAEAICLRLARYWDVPMPKASPERNREDDQTI